MSTEPRIAIVGIGGVFPGAPDLDRFWANVAAGVDASSEVPPGRWALEPAAVLGPGVAVPDKVHTSRGYYIADCSIDFSQLNVVAALVERLDPVFRLIIAAGQRAWDDAATDGVDRRRVGVILGHIALPTEKASALAVEVLGRTFAEKTGRKPSPGATDPLNRYVAGLPAGVLARALGLGGGTYTLDAACASSLYALKLAADELRSGRADLMLTGGAARPDCLYTQMGFAQLRALSPSGRCAPFDATGDGLVVGEGCGVLALKRLADAERDGDTIYAVLAGIGLSNDVAGNLLAPASEGQLRAMRAAYHQAGWKPSDVQLIECHATGTPVGDAVEFASLQALWGDENWSPGQCVLGSVKSSVGHLLTGAGSAGLIKILLAMRHGTLPPTANFRTPQARVRLAGSPFRILTESEPWPQHADAPRRAAISGFGFGGINAHVLLEEYRPAVSCESVSVSASPGEPIAIVGVGARFGPWRTQSDLRARMLGGGPPVAPAPQRHWWGIRESEWYRREHPNEQSFLGYYIDELEVPAGQFRIPPNELREMLPQQLLALQTAVAALAEARNWQAHHKRAGVFLGLGLDLNTTNFHFRWSVPELDRDAAHPALNANRTMGALGSIAASRIARAFQFEGPSFTICSEDSSAGTALEAAVRALRQRDLDLVLTGGVDLAGDPRAMLATDRIRRYSRSGLARLFDQSCEGPLGGEGAACFVLKRLSDAERDGDRVYAVVRGIGTANGGSAGMARPEPDAYREAARRAFADAGLEPATVTLVIGNGTGSPDEDRSEADTLADIFSAGGKVQPVLTSAVGDIGHAGAASFAATLLKACLALDQECLPPIRNMVRPIDQVNRAFRILPEPQYWATNRNDGPRRAVVSSSSVDGNCVCAVLEEYAPAKAERPASASVSSLGALDEYVFACRAQSPEDLRRRLAELANLVESNDGTLQTLAARWWSRQRIGDEARLGLALVACSITDLRALIDSASAHLARQPHEPLPSRDLVGHDAASRDRVFYSPAPLVKSGQLAFVFPGSGNHFAGMGRELAVRWPAAMRRQQIENECLRSQFAPEIFWDDWRRDPIEARSALFGQVTLAAFVTDVLDQFGVRPQACIGYSLGESAALFALRAWTARDEMFRRMQNSTLFVSDLAEPYDAVRKAWGASRDERIDWVTGVVACRAEQVRAELIPGQRVYLQIINSPDECVVGGQRDAVESLAQRLGRPFLPLSGVTVAHCEMVAPVATAYRDLHLLPVQPPDGVRFYSGATGRSYPLTTDAAADAILGHASATLDFPRVIESAYADGVRLFVEVGPGASCSRMIGRILNGRPHSARSACTAHADAVSTLLRLLASLYAEGVDVDFSPLFEAASDEPSPQQKLITIPVGGAPFRVTREVKANRTEFTPERDTPSAPPPPYLGDFGIGESQSGFLAGVVSTRAATARAHAAYLRFAELGSAAVADMLAFQQSLIPHFANDAPFIVDVAPTPVIVPPALDTDKCYEFARGSIAKALGSNFAPVDSHPTRVRLPDGPLMLVDRILTIEGEPMSLGAGRVITEHAVRSDRWYLAEGHIPTSIAVESGQADLFLSAFLGIDFVTKGMAVYRLLDAAVTFHDQLPQPGAVIRYDIHIDHFFRQGETHLFRFRFEGTVDGKPLLTMKNGCAGFFTAAELAAGKGVVQTALDLRPLPGKRPADWRELAPSASIESLDAHRLEALRLGDLAACFGPVFARLPLTAPLTLPGGMLKLVDRVIELDPTGGRYGLGRIRAEMDIRPDDWFLTCHFVDDMVMPGTLMYECCVHTLRVFLLRLGWVGERDRVRWEPVPGVASQLKCRGQVTAATRTVLYEVSLKEIGYRPEPFAICDALMYADGKPIVEIANMTLRLVGTTRAEIERLWDSQPVASVPPANPALFDRARITEFAVGKPSAAFGDRYRVFDDERVIARLPGPPFQFLDRITDVRNCEQWVMAAGGEVIAEYDVPANEWYFASNRQLTMPFAVLLEVALQPCGWLAAYLGSALTSPTDLSFRNLGGRATQFEAVGPDAGTLTTHAKITKVSSSGGMVIQNFDYRVSCAGRTVYQGDTYFGFFSKASLEQQVGLRDATPYRPGASETRRGRAFPVPRQAPFPDERLRMVDDVDLFIPDGGPLGLGYIRGSKRVNPGDWFFKAHFYQDPVWPGSLGVEALVQLLKVVAAEHWGADNLHSVQTMILGEPHTWVYRGQVVPANRLVRVEAYITGIDDATRTLRANGYLSVDDRVIYQMTDFTLQA